MAIKLGSVLKKKMLVIVNKEFLMNQWKEAIQKCSNARVGIIQQKKVEIENKDIVIGMLHSVCKIDYPEGTFDSFGYCVIDECFPYKQHILTDEGPIQMGTLYKLWVSGGELPLVRSYNEETKSYENKKITYFWKRSKTNTTLIKLKIGKSEIECTLGHKFLTRNGWKEAGELEKSDRIYTSKSGKFTRLMNTCVEEYNSVNVYDIEVEDNHNFIVSNSEGGDEILAHNCHHIASQMFSQALPKIATQHMLGLSATPERKDGLTPVFLNYLGPVFHKERRQGTNQVWIKFMEVASGSENYQEEVMKKSGTKNTVKMINNISNFETMNYLILEMVGILVKNKPRKIIILGKRREQLEWLNSHCQEACFKNSKGKYATCGLYYGNKGLRKDAYYKMLEESAKCDIIFGTNEIAAEGLDIPGLNTLILLQGGHDVEQAVGRILRKLHKEVPPTVIDMVYKCGNFPKHAKKRRDYYNYESYCHHGFKIRIGDDKASINPWVPKLEDFLENYTDTKAKNYVKEQHLVELVLEEDEDDIDDKAEPKAKSKAKSEPRGKCLIESSDEESSGEESKSEVKMSLNITMK
jgi:superfamily II DNA or RNA helicase